jgi:hypothetical protein
MLARWKRIWMASAIPVLFFSSPALVQTKEAWVDPPSDLFAPEAPVSEVKPLANVGANPTPSVLTSIPEGTARLTDEPKPITEAVQPIPADPLAEFSSLQQVMRHWQLPPPNVAMSEAAQPTRESTPPPPSTISRTAQPNNLTDIAQTEPAASPSSARPHVGEALVSDQVTRQAQDAQAFVVDYLNAWSAPNQVTLAAASSFYGPTVKFHGRDRTIGSVLSEKRRFTERWPQRDYRYRPETTMVACESDRSLCTVWAIFDYSAASSDQERRSQGIGEHELVVSLTGAKPVIVAENSRVLRRGAAKNH